MTKANKKTKKKKKVVKDPEAIPAADIEVSVKFGNEFIAELPPIGTTLSEDRSELIPISEIKKQLYKKRITRRTIIKGSDLSNLNFNDT